MSTCLEEVVFQTSAIFSYSIVQPVIKFYADIDLYFIQNQNGVILHSVCRISISLSFPVLTMLGLTIADQGVFSRSQRRFW